MLWKLAWSECKWKSRRPPTRGRTGQGHWANSEMCLGARATERPDALLVGGDLPADTAAVVFRNTSDPEAARGWGTHIETQHLPDPTGFI